MRVLVTGAAGFIGSNLCEYLLSNGHDVVGLDNFNSYYSPKIKEYNLKSFSDNKNFKLYRSDLLDNETLTELFEKEKPEAIVHLAAWAGVTRSLKEPITYVRNNLEATVNLAELAVKHGIKSFVLASTSSIYGDNPTPFTEDMTTDHPLAPYPATKKACEVMLSTYHRNFGLNVTIFRIFNPLGPKQRPDLALSILIRSCLYDDVAFHKYQSGTGRDYTYIKHMLEAMEHVVKNPLGYEILNLGNSKPVILEDMISTISKVTGKEPRIIEAEKRQGEMELTFANIEKAKNMINYNPSTTIEESIRIYYEWFLAQEEWYKKGQY